MPSMKWENEPYYITVLESWYHDCYRPDPMVPRRESASWHVPMSLWVGVTPLWIDPRMTAYSFVESCILPVVEDYNRFWNDGRHANRIKVPARWEAFTIGARLNKSNYLGFRIAVTPDCYAFLHSRVQRLTNGNPDSIIVINTANGLFEKDHDEAE